MTVVLLLHLDGKRDLPNLALAKLAAWHHARGDDVELRRVRRVEDLRPRLGDPAWGRVYGSLIFERTAPLARAAAAQYPSIELGGTGWAFEGGVQVRATELPPEVAAMRPDFSIYPGFEASLGYSQRGCRFKCSFCVVPRLEGRPRAESSLREIWRGPPWPRHIILLDNDFFGGPNWRDVIEEARAGAFKISLIQGINARLLSEEAADALASIKLMDTKFRRRRIYTAWDGRRDENVLFRGLERLTKPGRFSPDMLMVYMLIGHEPGETHADRDYRRRKLREFGARPYPMPYVRTPELVAFQRWVVRRHDVQTSWEEFWGRAKGEPRRLGARRVSLPLVDEESVREPDSPVPGQQPLFREVA